MDLPGTVMAEHVGCMSSADEVAENEASAPSSIDAVDGVAQNASTSSSRRDESQVRKDSGTSIRTTTSAAADPFAHDREQQKSLRSVSHDHTQFDDPLRHNSPTHDPRGEPLLGKAITKDDSIEAAPSSDPEVSDRHPLALKETARNAAHSAKKKLHLHHVHTNHLRKRFDLYHLHHDPESQGGNEEADHMRGAHSIAATKSGALTQHEANTQDHSPGQQHTMIVPEQSFARRVGLGCKEVFKSTIVMFSTFPYWDMAFWSGWSYSIGSVLFVIDGAWAWTPLAFPESEWPGEAEWGVPFLFFIGALFYQIGATMAYLEAVNDGSFAGSAMKRLLEGHDEDKKKLLDEKLHTFFGHIVPHHHRDDEGNDSHDQSVSQEVDPEVGWKLKDRDERSKPGYPTGKEPPSRRGGVDMGPTEEGEFHEYLSWRWWPTWHALSTYHIREVGYVACTIQLFGATLYGICGVVVLPGILSSLDPWQELAAYWVPQVVASCCFLTAGVLFTYVTQDKWYQPLPSKISWWIGAWATIGSVGFLLSACFGIESGSKTWCEYQSSLSSTWGSAAYLTSSLLQWYESVNKGPVLAFPNNRVPTLLR